MPRHAKGFKWAFSDPERAVAWSVPDEPHGVANESDGDLVLLVAMAPNPNV